MEIIKVIIEDTYFLTLFSVGVVLWITGRLVHSFLPKKINHIYGYRTKRSMKSQEAWDFAQKHNVELMIKSGIFLIGASILGPIVKFSPGWGVVISLTIILGAIAYMIYQTETALKEKFEK